MNISKVTLLVAVFIAGNIQAEFAQVQQERLSGLYSVGFKMVQDIGLLKTIEAITSFEGILIQMHQDIVPSLPKDELLPYFKQILEILMIDNVSAEKNILLLTILKNQLISNNFKKV